MKRILFLVTAVLMSAAIAGQASADFVNVDYSTAEGAPLSTFGGAANQAGFWNNPTPGGASPLLDLAGSATSWTVTNNTAAVFSFVNPSVPADAAPLMNDFIDGTTIITVSGFSAGTYDVYTYAWASDSATSSTNVSVNGQPNQLVGGAWPGGFQQFVTHALHQVTIGQGQDIVITSTAGTGFASLNGFQIVNTIPEPSSLALLGLGTVGLFLRRKRA